MKLGIGWDVITHAGTGLVALLAGALMWQSPVALWLFSALMLISAISAFWISWRQNAWVTGHWLAIDEDRAALNVTHHQWPESSPYISCSPA